MKKDTWFKMASENTERVTRATSDKSRLAVKRVKTERGHFFSQRVVELCRRLEQTARNKQRHQEYEGI